MRSYPQFSLWISITLVKIYICCIIINRGKNTFELVGTVLNRESIYSFSGVRGANSSQGCALYCVVPASFETPWLRNRMLPERGSKHVHKRNSFTDI